MAKKISPVFNASAVIEAFGAYDSATATATVALSDAINRTFQMFLDACKVSGIARTEEGVTWLMTAIRDSQDAIDSVAAGLMFRKTWTEYAQSAGRAYYWDLPFSADLKNDPERKLPWSKAGKTASAGKAGKVESTDRTALDATASKFLKQARLLGLNELAAEVLDVLIQRLDGFKESAE